VVNGISFAYLVALIDVYSRYVVAWRLSNTMGQQQQVVKKEGKRKRESLA
jgi:transposase InsO family protein